MEAQKYLGGLVTKNLKWNSQVLAACSKAKRMLGFLRRSTFDTHDQRARTLLYLSLVRSNLAYCSQVWAPQAVNLILDIERIQRRAAPGGWTLHMNGVGMLVVWLKGVNFGFWSQLGCSEQHAIIFSREGLV